MPRSIPNRGRMPDLTEEISAFCKEAPDAEQERPMAVLRYIARRHRLFFTYAVIILLVKHLAALLLPVFISNIINEVTDTGIYYLCDVIADVLGLDTDIEEPFKAKLWEELHFEKFLSQVSRETDGAVTGQFYQPGENYFVSGELFMMHNLAEAYVL